MSIVVCTINTPDCRLSIAKDLFVPSLFFTHVDEITCCPVSVWNYILIGYMVAKFQCNIDECILLVTFNKSTLSSAGTTKAVNKHRKCRADPGGDNSVDGMLARGFNNSCRWCMLTPPFHKP